MVEKITPQPSERWVMYKLVCPIIDKANAISRFEAYYEYSKPNGPNRRLSADIALVKDDKPIWLVEAKKFKRSVNPGFIAHYLETDILGCVTNGNFWTFVAEHQSATLGPLVKASGELDELVLNKLVSAFQCVNAECLKQALAPTSFNKVFQPPSKTQLPKLWRLNGGLGTRNFDKRQPDSTLADAALSSKDKTTEASATRSFLNKIIEGNLSVQLGTVTVSDKRIVWKIGNKRAVRIAFASNGLEILLHKNVANYNYDKPICCAKKMYDKNPNMILCKANTERELESLIQIFSFCGDLDNEAP